MEGIKLTSEQVGKLIEHQRNLNDIQQEIDKAEFCGVNCQEMRGMTAEAAERISRLLANYGPES